MPRARRLGQPAPVEFQVAPWRPAGRKRARRADNADAGAGAAGSARAAAPPDAPAPFCVEEVAAPVVVAAAASATAAAAPTIPPLAPSTGDARRPDQAPQWGQWRSRRRRDGGGGGEDDEAAAAATVAVEEEQQQAASEREDEEDEEKAEVPQQHRLSGVAQLALLPSGDMTGHFVAVVRAAGGGGGGAGASANGGGDDGGGSDGDPPCAAAGPLTPVCLAATARLVLAESTCMRDEEWSLLRLTLTANRTGSKEGDEDDGEEEEDGDDDGDDDDGDEGDDGIQGDGLWGGDVRNGGSLAPSSSASSVSFWVQRTGGDLCRITPADPHDEQTADAIVADEKARRRGAMQARARPRPSRHAPPGFSFRGESLYADAAAEAMLAQISPALLAVRGAAASAGGGNGGGGAGGGGGHLVVNAGPAEAEGLPAAFVRRVGAMAARAAARAAAVAGAGAGAACAGAGAEARAV